MSLFSKARARTITPLFRRNFLFPLNGMPTNPDTFIKEAIQEPHAEKLEPIVKFMLWIVIPGLSVYFWYEQYQELFVHRKRWPHPKHYFMNQGINRYPFGDGKHSPMHHEYFNFTPYGYETDKDGNRLPPGVYADE